MSLIKKKKKKKGKEKKRVTNVIILLVNIRRTKRIKLLFWPTPKASKLIFISQEVICNFTRPQRLILHLFQKLIC
jgi:hypothetical protein